MIEKEKEKGVTLKRPWSINPGLKIVKFQRANQRHMSSVSP